MFCTKCGIKNDDGNLFCENCGAKLVQINSANMQPIAPPDFRPDAQADLQSDAQAIAQPDIQPYLQSDVQAVAQPNVQPDYQPDMQAMAQRIPQPAQQPVGQQKQPVGKAIALICIAAVELIAISALLVVFFGMCSKIYSPERVAERYYRAMQSGNYKVAYRYLNIEEGQKDALTLESFERAHRNDETTFVTEPSVYISSRDGEKALVSVDGYTYALVKEGRKFLFFKNWKIDPLYSDNIAVDNLMVETGAGMDLIMDGENVGVSPEVSKDDKSYQIYTIPVAFSGTHDFELRMADLKTETMQIELNSYMGEPLYLGDVALDNDSMQALLDESVSDMQTILSALLAGEPFSKVSGLYAEDQQRDAGQEYNILQSYSYYPVEGRDYDYGLTKVDVNSLSASADYIYFMNGKLNVTVYLSYTYDYQYVDYTYGDDFTYTQKIFDGNDSDSCSFTYVYDGSEWKLNNEDFPYISW